MRERKQSESTGKAGIYRKYIKRMMDIVLSLIGLAVLSPVLLIVAALVRTKLGSPVLFKQERPGLNEEIFTLYKFRTMTDERDEEGNLYPDSRRLTKFGKILRASSLDELPELFNILKGDMSVIGPRPLLVKYLPLYNGDQRKRHLVRPGLTGLAQVSGRNAISWTDKFNLDKEYVENLTFTMDVKIFIRTIRKVFVKEGIEFTNTQTIYECLGKNENESEGKGKQQ